MNYWKAYKMKDDRHVAQMVDDMKVMDELNIEYDSTITLSGDEPILALFTQTEKTCRWLKFDKDLGFNWW